MTLKTAHESTALRQPCVTAAAVVVAAAAAAAAAAAVALGGSLGGLRASLDCAPARADTNVS